MTSAQAAYLTLTNQWLRCRRCGTDRWRCAISSFDGTEWIRSWVCECSPEAGFRQIRITVAESQEAQHVWRVAPALARIGTPP